MQHLLDEHYGDKTHVHIVQDKINTHTFGAFYEHLPAAKARALASKLTFHFTPKHGSWLNMAEIEFSVLSKQCVDRRIGSIEELDKEVQAWVAERNEKKSKINWLFDTPQARIKLKRHYIKVNPQNDPILNSNN